jgi:hypothetical protein
MTRGGEVTVVGCTDDEKCKKLIKLLEGAGYTVSFKSCEGCSTPLVLGPNGEVFRMAEVHTVLLPHNS